MPASSAAEGSRRTVRFITCFSTFLCNGTLALSIGALLPYIRDAYGLDYAFAGLLVSLHSVGNLVSSFAGGVLPLALGRRRSILCFSACYALSFALILFTRQPALLVLAFLMTGLARGAVSNFSNAETNMLAPGQAWALNALHGCFAIGAFTAPMLVLLCTQVLGDWRWMCRLLIVFGCVEWLIYLLMPLPVDRVPRPEAGKRDLGFFATRTFWVTVCMLFFYLCAEQGVIGWMVTYFQDTGIMSAGYAQTMASVLWVLILFGRLAAAWLSTRVPRTRLLLVMTAGMCVFFVLVLTARSLPLITLGIAGFGFSMAGVYPTTVSTAGALISEYPMAWSVILTIASCGSIVMPGIIGAVAQAGGIAMGISTILLAVAATLVMAIIMRVFARKEKQ